MTPHLSYVLRQGPADPPHLREDQIRIVIVVPAIRHFMSHLKREILVMALVVLLFFGGIVLPVGASLAQGSPIQINSTPSGAAAYVDGYLTGSTPAHLDYLSCGTYRLSLNREGYQKYSTNIDVGVDGHLIIVNATLVPDTIPEGKIRVNSTLIHYSEACVDGGVFKQVPAKFDNVSGNKYHIVTIRQSNKLNWYDNVLVMPGATTDVHEDIQPYEPEIARIRFNTKPSGGLFCIDTVRCWNGQGIWGNPEFRVQANQYHTVTIEYEGYRPFVTEKFVEPNKANQIEDVKIVLQPETIPVGAIQVNAVPAGGTVCLDGIRCDANVATIDGMGRALFVDVSANARHIITVNLTGYKPYSSPISVGENQTVMVNAPLQPIKPESIQAKFFGIVNIFSHWDLWSNPLQEKTHNTSSSRENGSSLTTLTQTIPPTNADIQPTAVPTQSANLSPTVVRPGDWVSIYLKMGDIKNNISIYSYITLLAGQTTKRYSVIPGTSDQCPDSRIFVMFSDEYNAISSGMVGMKQGEQKNISVHFKDKLETKTMSSEYLKTYKINASNLSAGQLFVGIYTEPNSSVRSTMLGKVVSTTHDYAQVDFSYPDLHITILQITNGSTNTTPVTSPIPAIKKVSPIQARLPAAH